MEDTERLTGDVGDERLYDVGYWNGRGFAWFAATSVTRVEAERVKAQGDLILCFGVLRIVSCEAQES